LANAVQGLIADLSSAQPRMSCSIRWTTSALEVNG